MTVISDPEARAVIAASLLSQAAGALTSAPARQLVSQGPPAWDCEQLVVWLQRVRPRLIGGQTKCAVVLVAEYHIGILRCVPTMRNDGTPPAAADLTSSATGLYTDAAEIQQELLANWLDGTLLASVSHPTPCQIVTVGDLTALAPAGGFAGWDFTLTIQLS